MRRMSTLKCLIENKLKSSLLLLFQAIKEYRAKNRTLSGENGSPEKKPANSKNAKLECELCQDFFHPSHVHLPMPAQGKP